jgi:hypothetical protein
LAVNISNNVANTGTNNVFRMAFSRDGLGIVCRPLLSAIGRERRRVHFLAIVAKTSQRCERFVFARDKETMYVPAVFRTAAILRDVKSQHHDGFPCPPLLKYRCLASI